MKLWKIGIILVAVIGISVGTYIGIKKSNEQKILEQIASSGAGDFLSFDTEYVRNFSLSQDGKTFDFQLNTDTSNWECTSDTMKVNNYTINYAIETMSTLETVKRIEENAQDLSIYGLDNPITLSCKNNSGTYSVQIGNASPTGEYYYIKSPDNNDVYTIDSSNTNIIIDSDDLKFRYIIDSYISIVNKIIYKKGDDIIFNCQKDDSGSWQLIEPQVSVETNLSKISSIADLLIRADVIDFISENPTDDELKQYGLDNPLYTIEIADDDEDRTIYLGNSPEDNVIYVQFADTKEVATFYMGEIGILNGGTELVLSDIIYSEDKKNISSIDVTYNGQTTSVGITYNEDDRSYSYTENGTTITDEDRINYLEALTNSTLQIPLYQIDLSAQPNGEPIVSINYTINSEPNTYNIKLIPTDDTNTYYYILSNDVYNGCIVRNRNLNYENNILEVLSR